MYLASPHETGPLAEHLSIDLYVVALGNPNMRMFVMSKDPVMLEDAYGYSTRYESLLLGAPEQTQSARREAPDGTILGGTTREEAAER